jgi:hypothetical protein
LTQEWNEKILEIFYKTKKLGWAEPKSRFSKGFQINFTFEIWVLRLARFSVKHKFQDWPSVAKWYLYVIWYSVPHIYPAKAGYYGLWGKWLGLVRDLFRSPQAVYKQKASYSESGDSQKDVPQGNIQDFWTFVIILKLTSPWLKGGGITVKSLFLLYIDKMTPILN